MRACVRACVRVDGVCVDGVCVSGVGRGAKSQDQETEK